MTDALERIETIKARADKLGSRDLAVAFVTALDAFVGRTCPRALLAETLVCRGLSAREALAMADLREALTQGCDDASL